LVGYFPLFRRKVFPPDFRRPFAFPDPPPSFFQARPFFSLVFFWCRIPGIIPLDLPPRCSLFNDNWRVILYGLSTPQRELFRSSLIPLSFVEFFSGGFLPGSPSALTPFTLHLYDFPLFPSDEPVFSPDSNRTSSFFTPLVGDFMTDKSLAAS